MSEGRDEKLTASQLKHEGKRRKRDRGSGMWGWKEGGTPPPACCRTLFFGGASSPVLGQEEGAGGGEGAQTWESIGL